jgi:hypothetical protein
MPHTTRLFCVCATRAPNYSGGSPLSQRPHPLLLPVDARVLFFRGVAAPPPLGPLPPQSFHPSVAEVLASGSIDATVKLWDVVSGALLRSVSCASPPVSVAFGASGSTLTIVLQYVPASPYLPAVRPHTHTPHPSACYVPAVPRVPFPDPATPCCPPSPPLPYPLTPPPPLPPPHIAPGPPLAIPHLMPFG